MRLFRVLMEYKTERLLLRSSTRQDSEVFYNMVQNDKENFRAYCGAEPTEKNLLATKKYLGRTNDINCTFSVFLKDSPDTMIGYVGIYLRSGSYELDCYIDKNYRNKGYCTEASMLVCENFFNGELIFTNSSDESYTAVFERINAEIIADNAVSKKMLGKLGFKKAQDIGFAMFMSMESDDEYYACQTFKYCLDKETFMR